MKIRKSYILIAVILIAISVALLYKSNPHTATKLETFNTKEQSLTTDAELIYNQIQSKYQALQQDKITPDQFKQEMLPLRDKMKNNWDEYKKFTQEHELSVSERQKKEFKDGVSLASNIRLNIYTFLINVTEQNVNKQQIEDKYKESLMQVDDKMKQYREVTKGLQSK